MNSIPFCLADVETQEVLASWRITDPVTLEYLIIFGAIGLVTLLLLLWAVFLRRRRRRRHSHHHSHQQSSGPTAAPEVPNEEGDLSPPEKRRHQRRAGRRHRSRNPTLAETGGLPPVRPEDSPEPRP